MPRFSADGLPDFSGKVTADALGRLLRQLVAWLRRDRVIAAPGGGLIEEHSGGCRAFSVAPSTAAAALVEDQVVKAYTSAGIPAKSGSILGLGTGKVYTYAMGSGVGTGGGDRTVTETIADSALDEDIYNDFDEAVPADTSLKIHKRSGVWMVLVWPCPP